MKFVISSGHSLYVRGAKGYLDEVNEARRVVSRLDSILQNAGESVITFNDDVSKTQSENLNRIVNYHNSQSRDYDVSVHFNAYQTTSKPMGTECLYVTQANLSGTIAKKISTAGKLTNRGAKKRTDLFFLNKTAKPAVLLEICFVDSSHDADLYNTHFEAICVGIAEALTGRTLGTKPEPAPEPEPEPPPTTDDSPILEIRTTGTVRIIINGEEFGTTQVTQSEPDPWE